jgi:hypothetical protein
MLKSILNRGCHADGRATQGVYFTKVGKMLVSNNKRAICCVLQRLYRCKTQLFFLIFKLLSAKMKCTPAYGNLNSEKVE